MRSKWLWVALALVAVLGITTAASATTRGLITGKQIAPHAVHGANESASSRGSTTSHSWDLVYISDSSGWGVARTYARLVRQGRGVSVRVHDEWLPGLRAETILERLRRPGDSWVRLIRSAEIIVVYGSPVGLGIPAVESVACVDGFTPPPAVSTRTWQPYVATLKAIYKRIFAIRKGKPVILRTANWYVPIVYHGAVRFGSVSPSWQDSGIIDVCTKFWESQMAAIAQAANAYRVPMADVYSAFNGPNHLEDPVAKGYLQDDNFHPNNRGRAVIAQTLAALGYKRLMPRR